MVSYNHSPFIGEKWWNMFPLKVHRRFLTPTEMLASHCLPTSSHQAKASGSPKLEISGAPSSALTRAAGNAMSVPCMGALVLACIMCIEPVKWKWVFRAHWKFDGNCNSRVQALKANQNLMDDSSLAWKNPKEPWAKESPKEARGETYQNGFTWLWPQYAAHFDQVLR